MRFSTRVRRLLPLLVAIALACVAALPAAARETAAATAAEAPHDFRDTAFDYFVAGDPRTPRAAHTSTGLALMGGGGGVDSAFRFIAMHAGGGHIVILRATTDPAFDADKGDYGLSFVGEWGPVTSAETLVFRSREAAFDPRVAAILRGADGIYLAGGDQSSYIRYWKGTPVQDLLDAHVRAHRPIGGSSAGLAILGRYSYTAFDGGSMESRVALADPFDAGVTLESDFLHCPWLDHVITDTHFSARARLGRLIVFVARLEQAQHDAHVIGLGIDEKTALLVGDDGVGRLAEGSAGHAWLVQPTRAARVLRAGAPLTFDAIALTRMDASSSLDFRTRRVAKPGAAEKVSIERGKASGPAAMQAMLQRAAAPPNEP